MTFTLQPWLLPFLVLGATLLIVRLIGENLGAATVVLGAGLLLSAGIFIGRMM